jgi:hypothetical protein
MHTLILTSDSKQKATKAKRARIPFQIVTNEIYGFHLKVGSREKHAEYEFAIHQERRGGDKTFDTNGTLMLYRVSRLLMHFHWTILCSDHAELSITKDRS